MKVYIDGKYYSKETASVSVYDHGLLYGDGVFEGIRIYNGSIFLLEEHIERLYDSAKAILLDIPMSKEEMCEKVTEAVTYNNKQDGYIRLVVTRGRGDLGINPYTCPKPSVIIIVDDIQLYPESHYKNGIALVTSAVRRVTPDIFDPRIKSLNYLNNIMAKMEAINSGCMEAIILNKEGYVAECTADNIFAIKDKTILTPSSVAGALDGITKQTVISLAEENGITVKECLMTRYDLYTADECFLTGTGAEIMPVISIDGRTIGSGKPGDMTISMLRLFRKFCEA